MVKSGLKIVASIVCIIAMSYLLYSTYYDFLTTAFQPLSGFTRLLHIIEIFILLFIMTGTIFYLNLVKWLVYVIMRNIKNLILMNKK